MKSMFKESNFLFILLALMQVSCIEAFCFETGHTTLGLWDSVRSRTIDTEVYYPSDSAGDDVAVSAGLYPVTVSKT